jgi:hypothetical protein
MQQLLLRGLLLGFGQFVLVWLVALVAEAGLITAVSRHNIQPVTLPQSLRWGQQRLRHFLAVDLLVFLPWFLIALAMLAVILILAILLASFATRDVGVGTVIATTGLGLTCLIGLAALLVPVGAVSLWYRLLAFRELVIHNVPPRTAVRLTWQRIRQNLGDIFVLIIMLWGGQTLVLTVFNLVTSPLLTWLTPLTNSDTMTLQAMAWLAVIGLTLLAWLGRGIIVVFAAIAWTLAYQNLDKNG